MPHYQVDPPRVPSEPQLPKLWQTDLRFWLKREGPVWGIYWAVKSRRINTVKQEAYLQRYDEWMKETAETLWEASDGDRAKTVIDRSRSGPRWTIYICADCGEHQHDHNRDECWKCGSGREWEEIGVVPAR